MRVSRALERDRSRPLVLSIGVFDGVHRGHREIISALHQLRRPGELIGALTFVNHPASYLRPGTEPPLITTVEERVTLLAELGLDEVYLIPFDGRLATLTAEAFLQSILIESLGVRAIAIGENFRFGSQRRGDALLARTVLEAAGRSVVAVPSLITGGERVSSTRVRAALAQGEMTEADGLLGSPYTLRGTVVLGDGRGHDLGFPTANLKWPAQKLVPMDGVYTVVGRHDGRDYHGLASIGNKPTFGAGEKAIEAWLCDFPRTIYGEELALREFRFVRAQQAFASADELRAQMQRDATHIAFPSFVSA
ncbi:MAG: riboflavin biosynthesis protein RibF [Candidatus Eremiobacteraeota bacterium]|nr:riboflavin biosynthesis protein RibF [Candidatus Eremiobacteraeota bacterium]MBV9647834.1 riboflavin biosynthesis protein RibF [Candidatus Eremiobacteraeota bacterium]